MNGMEAQLPSEREPNSSELTKEGAKGYRRFQTVQGKGKPCESGESGWYLEASAIQMKCPSVIYDACDKSKDTKSYMAPVPKLGHRKTI